MLMEDKGGFSSNFVLRSLNRRNPCSYKACSIFGSYEAMRYDSKSHPTDCYSNFSYILSLVDGASDIQIVSVVRWGNAHALVPTKAIPEVWTSVNIADGDAAGLE